MSASKSFYRLLVGFVFVDFQNKALFSSYAYFTWNAITTFSEESGAKLVHRVLLLYLVVSFALER